MEVTSITLNDAISFVFAFVCHYHNYQFYLSKTNLFPKLHLKYKVPMYVKEVRLMDSAKVRKKTILPFFSFTCYDFKFFFSSLQTIFKALPTFRSTYMGHVAAARKRSHQWCVSLTPNNTWVTYIA